MAGKKKNSLVENINRRKRSKTSRPKSKSTISKSAYKDMQRGWPDKKSTKKNSAKKATKRKR